MNLFVNLLLFSIGASVGSFLSVVIDRLPRGESLIISRSHCANCRKRLSWYDLIPLFSFIMLSGKCRYCHAEIPFRLFLQEVLIGLFFVVLYAYYSPFIVGIAPFITILIILLLLLLIFFIDLDAGIIPDQILMLLLLFTTVHHVITRGVFSLGGLLLVGILSFAAFLALFIGTRGRGMGLGDVKFAFIIGFLLGGVATVVAFYLSFLLGGIVSLLLIISGKKKMRGDSIPFGPFLVLGTVISYFWWSALIHRFFGVF